jgi:Fe-S-cluster containining protein
MRDGLIRRVLKAGARAVYMSDLTVKRRWNQFRGRRRWQLAGTCGGCAKCCEQPTIVVPRTMATWWTLRTTFLWWQRVVNGFELVETERRPAAFAFRCTHFDAETRRCDSYDSRPAMCRDYPRLLLDRPWPELFDGCGYRAQPTGSPSLIVALNAADGLDEDQREEVEKRLGLR